MTKRKYPKLPNKYGSIKVLSGKRTNPYAVYPPVTEYKENGSPIQPAALAYVKDWLTGFGVLTAYHNGTFRPGQEIPDYLDCKRQSDLVQNILSEYNTMKRAQASKPPQLTFAQVYAEFFNWKFVNNKARSYSKNTVVASNTAFNHLSALHDRPFAELRHRELQQTLDDSPFRHASIELMVSLLHQLYKYAIIHEIINQNEDYSSFIQINIPDDDEPGVPFSEKELNILWNHKDDPDVELMLIVCYSGYRILAYRTVIVNLEENYFLGGIKTRTSKNRIVPIHSAILPLVKTRLCRDGALLTCDPRNYRPKLYAALKRYGIQKHTPHDGRHTFSMLCEKYGVNENDRKRMMGHSFGSDITNSVYGHRSVEDLRNEIEKIKVCH